MHRQTAQTEEDDKDKHQLVDSNISNDPSGLHTEASNSGANVVQLLYPDDSIIEADELLGWGNDTLVLRYSADTVLKLPTRSSRLEDGKFQPPESIYDRRAFEAIDREERIYRRFNEQKAQGIAEYLGSEKGGILLKYYSRGSVENIIEKEEALPSATRLKWMSEAISIVSEFRRAHIMQFDIAPRNFVVADDISLKAIDFGQALTYPIDTDMDAVNHQGFTGRVAMFDLGSLLYSIATWQKVNLECWSEAAWPDASSLPSTDGVPWGFLIRNCWMGRYRSVDQLLRESRSPRLRRKQKVRAGKKLKSQGNA